MPRRQTVAAFATVALLAGLVAACGGAPEPTTVAGPSPTSTSEPTRGVPDQDLTMAILAGPGGRGMAETAVSATEAACDTCSVEFWIASTPQEQQRHLNTVVNNGTGVVAIQPIDPAALAPQVRRLEAAATTVISLGTPIPGASYHIGHRPRSAGSRLAQALLDALHGGLVAQVTGEATAGFDAGAASVLDTDVSLDLGDLAPSGDSAGRTAAFVGTRIRQRGLDAVLASSPRQASGAARAVRRTGAEDVLLAAPGAGVPTWRRMLTGRQALTLLTPPRRTGRALADLLTAIARSDAPDPGAGPEPATVARVPAMIVSADEIHHAVIATAVPLSRVCDGLKAACRRAGLR